MSITFLGTTREAPARNRKPFAFDPKSIGVTCVDAAEEIVAALEAFYGGKPPSPETARG